MPDDERSIRLELMDIDHLSREEDYEPADIEIEKRDEHRCERSVDN